MPRLVKISICGMAHRFVRGDDRYKLRYVKCNNNLRFRIL
jgi:hypothetical protein